METHPEKAVRVAESIYLTSGLEAPSGSGQKPEPQQFRVLPQTLVESEEQGTNSARQRRRPLRTMTHCSVCDENSGLSRA
jgi:hypothetical protein